MEFRSVSHIRHSRDKVFAAYRDRLPEIASYIPDIKEIQVRSRSDDAGVVRLHNVWVGDREIPPVAQKWIKPEHLRWDDFAEWHTSGWYCSWRLAVHVFPDAVTCSGRNTFTERGAGTDVTLTGELKIDLRNVPGVPSLMRGAVTPAIEKFIVSLVTPNLERVNASLQQFLDERG